jgi:hypothetical protein
MCRVGTRAASPSAFPALYRGDDATGVETLGYEPSSQNPNVRVWVFTVDEKYSSRHAGVKELIEDQNKNPDCSVVREADRARVNRRINNSKPGEIVRAVALIIQSEIRRNLPKQPYAARFKNTVSGLNLINNRKLVPSALAH